MMHNLKILQPFFKSVIRGEKNFEIRNNSDRGFQKGDVVNLIEIKRDAIIDTPIGREQLININYVSNYNQPANQVVFGFYLVGDVVEN